MLLAVAFPLRLGTLWPAWLLGIKIIAVWAAVEKATKQSTAEDKTCEDGQFIFF